MTRQLLVLELALAGLCACSRPRLSVAPCDSDLGYLGEKLHLANVRFLKESRQMDWFEIYDNLEYRRSLRPAANCIPVSAPIATERAIEREEYSLRNLR